MDPGRRRVLEFKVAVASGVVSGGKGYQGLSQCSHQRPPSPKLCPMRSSEEDGSEITQGPPQGARRQQGSGKGLPIIFLWQFPLPTVGGQGKT